MNMLFNPNRIAVRFIAAIVCIVFLWQDVVWAAGPRISSSHLRQGQFCEVRGTRDGSGAASAGGAAAIGRETLRKVVRKAAKSVSKSALDSDKERITKREILTKAASDLGIEYSQLMELIRDYKLIPVIRDIWRMADLRFKQECQDKASRRKEVLVCLIKAGGDLKKARQMLGIKSPSAMTMLLSELGLKEKHQDIDRKVNELLSAIAFAGTLKLKEAARQKGYRQAGHRLTLSQQGVRHLIDRYGLTESVKESLTVRRQILRLLEQEGGNQARVADKLNISHSQMSRTLRKYGLLKIAQDIKGEVDKIVKALKDSGGSLTKAAKLCGWSYSKFCIKLFRKYRFVKEIVVVRKRASQILRLLQQANGNIDEAERLSGIKTSTLQRLINMYGLRKELEKIRNRYHRCRRLRIRYALRQSGGDLHKAAELLQDIKYYALKSAVKRYGLEEFRKSLKGPRRMGTINPIRYVPREVVEGKLRELITERRLAKKPPTARAWYSANQILLKVARQHNLPYQLPRRDAAGRSATAQPASAAGRGLASTTGHSKTAFATSITVTTALTARQRAIESELANAKVIERKQLELARIAELVYCIEYLRQRAQRAKRHPATYIKLKSREIKDTEGFRDKLLGVCA